MKETMRRIGMICFILMWIPFGIAIIDLLIKGPAIQDDLHSGVIPGLIFSVIGLFVAGILLVVAPVVMDEIKKRSL